MTTDLVPQDIYLKHESEWQALKEAFGNGIDIQKRKTALGNITGGGTKVPPENDSSTGQPANSDRN
ncbi:hypothetical protein [Rhizobium sullae]|uniref:hypothetical protein n=1 Tax=Rhizobium sullae TaxID=50338 RepID=UPI000B359ABF|nr:hypothetical protein [Rhizobium sullae]